MAGLGVVRSITSDNAMHVEPSSQANKEMNTFGLNGHSTYLGKQPFGKVEPLLPIKTTQAGPSIQ